MDEKRSVIRILLADDHSIFRSGLRCLLEREPDFRIVGEAADAQETARLAREGKTDILLVSLQLPGLARTDHLRRLYGGRRKVRAVVLVPASARDEIADIFQRGASGVVLKDSAAEVLVLGIRSVMAGNLWIGTQAVARNGKGPRKLPDLSGTKPRLRKFGLTRRELEIVAAIVSGYSNREIARKFTISEDTVKHHATNIFDKVGVCNRLELALFAIHHGLVKQVSSGR
ncbi:MAG: response regulator transcription factor [Acidobacteriia bacterium]|nr:response regulator transcription factor [Terriglobia bacterium]